MFFIKAQKQERKFSVPVLLAVVLQVFAPLHTFALTGGPSQSEYESFEPAGASEMVNIATGDFVYNIPLMDVDGYPINIAYHAGVTMEQEATWVGLGWNLNVGSVSRAMRGLPDEFDGDIVQEKINIKENKTYGVDLGLGVELVGIDFFNLINLGAQLQLGFGVNYNNYKGLGLSVEMGVTSDLSASGYGASGSIGGGLGLKISNSDGADFTMNGNLGGQLGIGNVTSMGKSHLKGWNSRQGMTADIVSGSTASGVSIGGIGYMSGTGQSINLIPNTAYTPSMEYATKFSGITGELHVGGELFWCNGYGYLRGHYFEQKLDGNDYSRPAYGYLNLQNAGDNAMMDFNRDKDGTYYLECPKLPFATLTYDLYNTNAQGLNELYRPHRNDFGHVHDNLTTGGGVANDIGLEGNLGNLFEIGVNDYSVESYNTSGDWITGNNALASGNKFVGDNQLTNPGSDRYNAAYFKALDEMVIQSGVTLGGTSAAQFEIQPGQPVATLMNSLIGGPNYTGLGSYSGARRITRDVRANDFSFLTVREAQAVLPTNTTSNKNDIVNFPLNTFNYTPDGDVDPASGAFVPRNHGIANIDHHISEVSVVKDDGSRYNYGVAVYNMGFKEELFNVSGLSVTDQDVVDYTSADNSTNNANGLDNFYNSKTLPAYAHSYLLTSLLSSDYIDITGNGMTQDDYGDYKKFNYTQTSVKYGWRNPVTAGGTQALYEPVLRADNRDDKAAVVTGSKELWYLHSIETKDYVAEFHLSDRLDGLGVNSVGTVMSGPNDTPQRLDKIVLFCKRDLSRPVKTVFFEYDYSLCPGTPNSTGPNAAKLTLKKIYSSYGTSDKSVFNPYLFTYANGNPSYDRRWVDRWGYNQTATGVFTDNNKDFPYTSQDEATVNANAAAWTLSAIETPAKSHINVYYEADSYAYVQDKTPAQMITMMEFTDTEPGPGYAPTVPSAATTSNLYNTSAPYAPKNWVVVDLSLLAGGGLEAVGQAAADIAFRNRVLPQINGNGKRQLYFRGIVKIGPNGGQDELIPGYAEFDPQASAVIGTSSTPLPNGNTLYKYAYVKLKEVDIEDQATYAVDNCNPISKAGWQITRLMHPRIAYPGSEPTNVLAALAGLWASIQEVNTFQQKNNRLRKKGYSAVIYPAKSVVRVNVPTRAKFGGGHRVSKIEIIDNWNNSVSAEATTTFGQTYDYTILDNNETLTSGVASYEPTVGADENCMREPLEYSVERIAAPDDAHFIEKPIGESFFPPPTVIYRKVTVRNLDRPDGNGVPVTKNLGRTEYQFYTSKDFPITSAMNGLKSEVFYPDPQGDLFNPSIQTSACVSQGFVLRLNNMHGKLKSILVFQEGNNLAVSGNRYFYKTNFNKKVLNNNIDVMTAGSVISNKVVGQDIDAVSDMRSSSSVTFGKTFRANANVSFIAPVPFPIPIPSWFNGASSETRDFFSASLCKIITQNGILNKIETIDNYATSTTEHLVWDEVTHEPILSRTTTKFKDFDYDYSTRAYWVYDGMGGAYQNTGYGFQDKVAHATGIVSVGAGMMWQGDEVEMIYTDTNDKIKGIYGDRLWINKVGNSFVLIDRNGKTCGTGTGMNNIFTNTAVVPSGTAHYVIKIIRSGYRNNLKDVAETIDFLGNPNFGGGINKSNNVLDATATEFSENWPGFCNASAVSCADQSFVSTNPYILNAKGNWHARRSYTYLTERKETGTGNVFDIRTTGTYKSFVPFFNGSVPVYDPSRSTYTASIPFASWVLNSEVTGINPNGHIVEGKDALNRYSSALYGYNQSLRTASAVNARFREIGNENLEDRSYPGHCVDNHFYLNGNYYVTDATAHTGRYSGVLEYEHTAYYVLAPTDVECVKAYGSNNVYLKPAGGGTTSAVYGFSNTTSCTSCLTQVSPFIKYAAEQKYIFSMWFKEGAANADGNYTVPIVLVINGPASISQVSKSNIIDGWQKFDYELTVQPNISANVTLGIRNMTVGAVLYFDDIRFYPKNAMMSTYVYDTKTLRLWAELDAQNFATFYTYNSEGAMVGVKKETERGIMSIKESRNSFKKN